MTLLNRAVAQWRAFASGSVNRRIFHAMVIITAATFVVKLAAVAKDVILAGSFGLGDELDAFLIALVVPDFALLVLAHSFNAAFMPAYIRLRDQKGPENAGRLLANVMILNFCVMLVCCLILASVSEPLFKLLAFEFSEEKRSLARELFIVLLPMIVLGGQLTLWGAALNAGEKFALVALAPVLTPLFVIVALFVLGGEGFDIRAVAWGTTIGCAAELTVVGAVLARRGLLPVPRWHRRMQAVPEVLHQYAPLVMSAMIMSSSGIIDQAMASWLGSGSVAALNYGQKIPAFVAGIGMTALGTALLPHFSRLVSLGDHAAVRHTFKTYARWIVFISVPATIFLIAASELIVTVLFQRGAFSAQDTAAVTLIQQMFLLQVPFLVLGILGVRILVAMSKNHLLMWMSIVNLIVHVSGNLIFMRWFGVSGIALSNSVVYMVSMCMIFVFLNRELRGWRLARAVNP